MSLEFGLMPSGLFSLRLTFEILKSESLRDVSITRIGDTFPMVFHRLTSHTFSGNGTAFWIFPEYYFAGYHLLSLLTSVLICYLHLISSLNIYLIVHHGEEKTDCAQAKYCIR